MLAMGGLYRLMKNRNEYLHPANCRFHLAHKTDKWTTENI